MCSVGGGFRDRPLAGRERGRSEGQPRASGGDDDTTSPLVLSTSGADLLLSVGVVLGSRSPPWCPLLQSGIDRAAPPDGSSLSSCDEEFSHSTSKLLGFRANRDVGRVEKEEASSGSSESDAKPPNSNIAMVVTGSVGGSEGSGLSIKGNDWNSKFDVGDGEREMYRQLMKKRSIRVCV